MSHSRSSKGFPNCSTTAAFILSAMGNSSHRLDHATRISFLFTNSLMPRSESSRP